MKGIRIKEVLHREGTSQICMDMDMDMARVGSLANADSCRRIRLSASGSFGQFHDVVFYSTPIMMFDALMMV